MAKAAAKSNAFDIVILGDHAAAHLATAVLRADQPKLNIAQIALPGEKHFDRLAMVNPKLFSLHAVMKDLEKEKSLTRTSGLQFLSETANLRGEFTSKSPTSITLSTESFRQKMIDVARSAGATQLRPKALLVNRVLDDGVELALDGSPITARIVLVTGGMNIDSRRVLGIPLHGEDDTTQHLRVLRLCPAKNFIQMPANVVPMSLDLAGGGAWAWALQSGDVVELSILQPARGLRDPNKNMAAWIENLALHGIIQSPEKLPKPESAATFALPIAAALSGETVANRTLLFGPAGGFVSACAEEVYPSCWSAVIAAKIAAAALKQRHVQDALLEFRGEWGSTLGDYLRGPQQNLKLLLPLVYRNNIMSARVAEAILLGESVVR